MGCSFSSDVINKNDLEIINKSKENQLLLEKQQSAKSRYSGWRKEVSLFSIYSNAGDVLDIVEEQEEEDVCEITNNSEAPLIEIDNSTVITVEESKVIEHHSTTLTVNHYNNNNRRQSIFCDEPLYLLENNLNSSFASSLKEKTIQTIDIDNKNITQ